MSLRRSGMWVGMVTVMVLTPVAAVADQPRVTAAAAVLMDAATGEVMWSRRADDELPPASTTKVMTAVLALESEQLHRSFPASAEACRVIPSKVNLRPGQRLKLEDLVYAILLNSANDASVVIAESLAGSVSAFGDRMTARARQIGALNSRFHNPHGLTQEGHYSTARDLALIFRHALTVPSFRDIASTKSTVVHVVNARRRISLRSHNRLLEGYRIPVIGKTGYTLAAKKCFVGAGTHDGREILVAVLGSKDLWGDVRKLLELGFGDAMPPAPPALQPARLHPVKKRGARRQMATVGTKAKRPAVRRMAARSTSGAASSRYAVRVASFDAMASARRLQQTLGKKGLNAHIQQVAGKNGRRKRTQYVVQVGPYADRTQAESAARKVKSKVNLPAQIVRR